MTLPNVMGERHKAFAVITPMRDYGETSRAQGKERIEQPRITASFVF